MTLKLDLRPHPQKDDRTTQGGRRRRDTYETIKCLYVIKKIGFRYRQADTAGVAAVERLEPTAGLASVARSLRKAHVAKHFGVEKPTQKLRSFFSR
jgi:hypothetical protein